MEFNFTQNPLSGFNPSVDHVGLLVSNECKILHEIEEVLEIHDFHTTFLFSTNYFHSNFVLYRSEFGFKDLTISM